MSDFTFRLRLTLPPTVALNVDTPALDLSGPHHPSLTLASADTDLAIRESKDRVLRGAGHSSEEEAVQSGERFRDVLSLAFAWWRIGADFGERRLTGWAFGQNNRWWNTSLPGPPTGSARSRLLWRWPWPFTT